MTEIKWIKITTDLFDDEAIKVIEQMPEGDAIIVVWLKLLIATGKLNDGGLLYFRKEIPYTEEMLSMVFNKPLNIIKLALKTFENFGMIQITNEQGIYVTNWDKYQNLAGMEQIKEYNRLAKRKQRAKAKELQMLSQGQCQGQVIDSHETDIDKDIDKDIDNRSSSSSISEEEEEILKKVAERNGIGCFSQWLRKLISNGDYKQILEQEKAKKVERETVKNQLNDDFLKVKDKYTACCFICKYWNNSGGEHPEKVNKLMDQYNITLYDDAMNYVHERS